MNEPEIIKVLIDDIEKIRNMSGFVSTCRYGKGMEIMKGEIGAIARHCSDDIFDPQTGLWEQTVIIEKRFVMR